MKKLIISILPGLFLIGFNIGTGSVTAMAKAGANYGMGLLWAVLLSCLVTYYLMYLYGKFTVVTGLTALQAFRKHIHPGVSIFLIVALGVNVSGGIMGVMGIVNDVLYEWSKQWTDGGISPLVWTSITAGAVYLLFLNGKTSTFEKVLSLIVAIMGVAFFVNFLILRPPLQDIANGLVPHIPEKLVGESNVFLVLAGMVGTTISSMVMLVRTTLVKEQGWTVSDLSIQKRDAAVSATMMFVISASIMAAAAGTLYISGQTLSETKELVTLLEPFAGKYAIGLFVIGIAAAGISSHFPNVLLLPWLICDHMGIKRDMTRPVFRILVLVMSLLSFVVPVFHQRPIAVLIASQALAALVLPATVACIFYVTNKRSLMGEHKNNWYDNVILAGVQLFALVIGGIGLKGFWDML